METPSGKSYPQLLKQIEDLIARGTKASDASAGTPSAQIHDWVNEAEYCLSLLEEKIPTALSEFRRIRQSFEFKVDDGEEDLSSASAYVLEKGDVLMDFNFEHLGRATEILKFAATKLEIEGTLSNPAPKKGLGEELLAARLRAGHSQREAAEKMGYDHKAVSEWETGKRKPHPKAAKDISDYITKYPKSNQS